MTRRVTRPTSTLPSLILCAAVSLTGCSDDADEEPDIDGGIDAVLVTTDGTTLPARSLRCIYRQSTGADNTLSLQLQYLDSPDTVAFALYVDDPVPATPFAVTAGRQGSYSFEAFSDGVGYRDALSDGEVELRLDDLPSPSILSDGDVVPLEGTVLIDGFSLPETSGSGDVGGGALDLAPGSVDVSCDAVFQLVEVFE